MCLPADISEIVRKKERKSISNPFLLPICPFSAAFDTENQNIPTVSDKGAGENCL